MLSNSGCSAFPHLLRRGTSKFSWQHVLLIPGKSLAWRLLAWSNQSGFFWRRCTSRKGQSWCGGELNLLHLRAPHIRCVFLIVSIPELQGSSSTALVFSNHCQGIPSWPDASRFPVHRTIWTCLAYLHRYTYPCAPIQFPSHITSIKVYTDYIFEPCPEGKFYKFWC